MKPELADKVALITGAGSGIGRAAARLFAEEGARVVVVGRRPAPLEEVAAEIRKAGGEAAAHPADLADTARAGEVARWALERHGRVDILVNNAGSSSRVRNVLWTGLDDWNRMLEVNLTGVFALTQALLPSMLERRSGTIITVSSAAALRPGLIGGAAYGAAKAAVRHLMGHIHTVFRNRGLRATTIIPAEVDTPILENRPLVPGGKARATMMRPEDVARAILFCATLPERAVVEEIVLSPTFQRDLTEDTRAAEEFGAR